MLVPLALVLSAAVFDCPSLRTEYARAESDGYVVSVSACEVLGLNANPDGAADAARRAALEHAYRQLPSEVSVVSVAVREVRETLSLAGTTVLASRGDWLLAERREDIRWLRPARSPRGVEVSIRLRFIARQANAAYAIDVTWRTPSGTPASEDVPLTGTVAATQESSVWIYEMIAPDSLVQILPHCASEGPVRVAGQQSIETLDPAIEMRIDRSRTHVSLWIAVQGNPPAVSPPGGVAGDCLLDGQLALPEPVALESVTRWYLAHAPRSGRDFTFLIVPPQRVGRER